MEEMKAESWVKRCLGKKRLRTRGYANGVAKRLGLRVYYCMDCYGFHLTSTFDRRSQTGIADRVFDILGRINGWELGQ